jgi:branched-chain amino acid aminotransferase
MTTGKILGQTYVINGSTADTGEFPSGLPADVYYEVVRVISGKVLFLNDHLKRFRKSVESGGLPYPGHEAVISSLRQLLKHNDFTEGNIRICLQPGSSGDSDLLSYFIPYFYPEECTYLSGVQLVTYRYMRSNPGIKKWDNNFRESVAGTIREHGVYEAILVNEKDEVTEGSRSNLFFIDSGRQLVTPPENCILPGITRKYVLQICRKEGIGVIERPVPRKELASMESCFISGTSPKVLPVWQIDGFQFRVDNPVLKTIMDRFEFVLKENLQTIL